MKKRSWLMIALGLVLFGLSLLTGPITASAQPFPEYWIEVKDMFPPFPPGTFPIDVIYEDGYEETQSPPEDGLFHFSYANHGNIIGARICDVFVPCNQRTWVICELPPAGSGRLVCLEVELRCPPQARYVEIRIRYKHDVDPENPDCD